MADDEKDILSARISAHLAEFSARREEIKQRSLFQHSYIMFLLVADGAIASFALCAPERLCTLLAVPFLTLVVYMLWVHQALVIMEIGRYIQDRLESDCTCWLKHPVLTWETEGREVPRAARAVRRTCYLVLHAIICCLVPLGVNVVLVTHISVLYPAKFRATYIVLLVLSCLASLLCLGLYLFWHLQFYKALERRGRTEVSAHEAKRKKEAGGGDS